MSLSMESGGAEESFEVLSEGGGGDDEALRAVLGVDSLAYHTHATLQRGKVSEQSLCAAASVVGGADAARAVAALLDERVVLRAALRHNTAGLRARLLALAAAQDDVAATQRAHRHRFAQTRALVLQLRAENAQLRSEVSSLRGDNAAGSQCGVGSLEFVTSPDDDTLHKLTAQLELVERQRREVIAENEKLTWQRESLERLLDAADTERAQLRGQLGALQEESTAKERASARERQSLQDSRQGLQDQLRQVGNQGIQTEELQRELQTCRADLHALNTVKAEAAAAARDYRAQLRLLHERLQHAQTVVLGGPREAAGAGVADGTESHVRVYDQALHHLAQTLNSLVSAVSEGLLRAAQEAGGGGGAGAADTTDTLCGRLHELHAHSLQHVGEVRAALSVLEQILSDHREALRRLHAADNQSADSLAAALVSRDAELGRLRELCACMQRDSDERDHLRAQLQVFRDDFSAERESRQQLASEKDSLLAEVRALRRQNDELLQQLEKVRVMNPNIYQHATGRTDARAPPRAPAAPAAPAPAVYSCPKCGVTCERYEQIERHVQRCLDE